MLIKRKSLATGIVRELDLPITREQLENYYNGMLVQHAFPNLSDDQREFIVSGITKEEWEQIFGRLQD